MIIIIIINGGTTFPGKRAEAYTRRTALGKLAVQRSRERVRTRSWLEVHEHESGSVQRPATAYGAGSPRGSRVGTGSGAKTSRSSV